MRRTLTIPGSWSLFAEDYRSTQPLHPNRTFGGRAQVFDGSVFAMRGITVFVVHEGLVTEGRLYMEPVEVGGGDIEASVQELYKPPPGPSA